MFPVAFEGIVWELIIHSGDSKWRGPDRAEKDQRQTELEDNAKEVSQEEKKRARADKRALIFQQAEKDNKSESADERQAKAQKFFDESFAKECEMKRRMHNEMLDVLKTLAAAAPSSDDKIPAKLPVRTLSEMSNALSALGPDNAARPLYERQIEF